MIKILLDLESWYTTLVLNRKWILEEIWGSIQFHVFLFAWNLLVSVCPLFLSLYWHFSCQCRGSNKNGTTRWGIGSEDILSVSILNHTGESSIVSIRICPRVFLHLVMKFPSDREELLVEMYILLSLAIFGPCGRGKKVRNKWNNKLSETIFWDVPHPVHLVWLVVESNNIC